tara:strand:+ start:62575 stop:62802 length:228 start_codon:yes stop_codon:yes gene_type:complete
MTYLSSQTCPAPVRRSVWHNLSWLKKLEAFASLARQRRALRRLNAQQLTDIGISKAQASREARKPLWDAPDHWYK